MNSIEHNHKNTSHSTLADKFNAGINTIAFNSSKGKWALESLMQKNIHDILYGDDFEVRLRSLSTYDLHVHPIKITKKGEFVTLESIDDERNIDGEKYVDSTTLNIRTLKWSKPISSRFMFIIQTVLGHNNTFVPFGNEHGSYTTVGTKHVPGFLEARKLPYKERLEALKNARNKN